MNYLERHIEDLKARILACDVANASLIAERDALIAKIQPLEAELRVVQQKLKVAEAPKRALGNEFAAAVRAKPTTKSLATTAEGA